ncbi:MAG: sugar transferase [Cyanobacteria bacterium]|nr:sugar transferase [Cyanobacteriota bacterium]MDW8202530.1 sugar transferase [Cyanobacteriota bacterium SKYGB_h_bin112]
MEHKSSEEPIAIIQFNQRSILRLPKLLSVHQAVSLKQKCQIACEADPKPSQIVLDLQQTTFVDSSGIGALVSSQKIAKAHGVDVVLWNVKNQPLEVMSLTGMENFFKIETPTADEMPPELDPSITKSDNSDDASVSLLPENRDAPVSLPSYAEDRTAYHPSVRSKVKRAIDIVGALVGLGITAILFIPIAIAIKLNSPGPIFFSQVRSGWMGRRFRIWKFRSMVANAEALKSQVENQAEGNFFKNENDPRITKVGRFLRKTSLDEFPQFWNVLKGEMSLVGTRPPSVDEIEKYDVPEWQRLDVKPGITGEWQVSGRSKIRKFEDVIRLDLKYQRNWSLKHDFEIILKTILVLFFKSDDAF